MTIERARRFRFPFVGVPLVAALFSLAVPMIPRAVDAVERMPQGAFDGLVQLAQSVNPKLQPGLSLADIRMKTENGADTKISDFRGKIVFVNFWGSWCPPCVKEAPFLQRMYDRFKNDSRIAWIFLQVLEPMETSVKWRDRKGYTLPVYSSMQTGRRDYRMQLGDGTEVDPRSLGVRSYPTSVLLDRNGVVVKYTEEINSTFLSWEDMLREMTKS